MSKFIVFENDLTPDGYCIGGEEIEVKYDQWGEVYQAMYKGVDVLPVISQFEGMKAFMKAEKKAKDFEQYING